MSNIAAGKELDDEGEKLNDVEESLNRVGIKLRENETDWRNFYSVLDEIASKWEGFTDTEKSQITTALGGTRQRENILTMLENWDKVKEYADIGANANGTAMEKYGIVLESVSAKQDQLTAKVQEFYGSILNSGFIATLLDIAQSFMDIMNVGDGLIGKITLLIALFAALQAIMKTNIFKGLASIFASIGKNIVNIIAAIPVWISGIKSTTAAQKALTVAQEESNAAAAANPYVAIAELIIMAIMGIIMAIKAHNRAIEESIEKAKELKENYEEASSKISENLIKLTSVNDNGTSLSEEFKKLADGVDAYGANINLTNTEYNRYLEICDMLVNINPDIAKGYNTNAEAIANNKDAVDELIKSQKELANETAKNNINNIGDIVSGTQNEYEKDFDNLNVPFGMYNTSSTNKGMSTKNRGVIKYIEDVIGVQQDIWNESASEYIVKNYREIYDNMDEILESLSEEYVDSEGYVFSAFSEKQIEEIKKSFNEIKGFIDKYSNTMRSTYQSAMVASQEYLDGTLTASGRKFITEWINNSKYFDYSGEDEEEIKKRIETVQAMVKAVVANGNEEIQNQLDELFTLDGSKMTYSEYTAKVNELITQIVNAINAGLPEDKQIKIDDIKIQLGFDFDKQGQNIDKIAEQLQQRIGGSVDEIKEKINSLSYDQVQELLKVDLSNIDNWNEFITRINMLGVALTNTESAIEDFATQMESAKSDMEILSKAIDEFNESGSISAATFKKIIDNDLLQYLDFTGNKLKIVDGSLYDTTNNAMSLEQQLKNTAIANLQAGLASDIYKLATEGVSDAELEAKKNSEKAGNAITIMGNKFAEASGGILTAAMAADIYNKATGDTTGLEGKENQLKSLVNQYNNAIAAVNKISISGTNASKRSSSTTNKVLSNMKKQVESLESPIKVLDNQIKELGNIDTIDEYNKQLDLVNKKSVLISKNITQIQNLIKKTKDKETLQYLKEKLSSYKADLANIKDTIDNIRLNKLKLQLEDLEKPIKDVDDAIKRIGDINTVEEKEKEASLLAEKFRLISSNIKTINELLKDTTLSKDMRELLEKELQDLLVDRVGIRDSIESNIKESVELEKKNAQLQAELDYKQKLYDIETALYGNDGKDTWEHLQEERIAAIQKEIDARNEEKEAQEKITEEQELQNKLLEAKISLQNALNNKTVKILTKQDDGTWQYEYSANMADVKSATDNLKNAQKEYDDWKKEQDVQKLQDEINALNKEKEEKSNTYSDNEFHLKQSLEAQTNSIEEYYDDIDKITQKRMADYQKIYGDEWDKVIGIAQQKVAKLSALNTELTAKSQYAFETVGTDNTYVKKVQSFGVGGTIRGSGLAFVHDKERVLTSQQNSLFEKVVSKLPNLLKISDMFRRTDVVNSRIGGVNNNNNTSSDKITINKVECVFPNATNSTEIQKAILGLPRLAIQK